jgi:hypothetical protein
MSSSSPSASVSAYTSVSQGLLGPGRMDEESLKEFVDRKIYSNSSLFLRDYSRFRRAELYDQSKQWLQSIRATSDASAPSQWEELSVNPADPNATPLPTYNEGVLLRENESARLGRPEYKPRVRPRSTTPDVREKEGAKGAERALQSRLKEMWSGQEDLFFLHPPLYGGVWLESRWDETWLETVRVPAPALCCPRHPKSGVPEDSPVRMGPPPLFVPGSEESSALPASSPASPALATSEFAPPSPEDEMERGEGISTYDDDMGLNGGLPGLGGDATALPSPLSCSYVRKKTPAEMDEKEGGAPRPFDPSASTPVGNEDGGCCPHCPDHPALVPYLASMEEALDDSSQLGRDLPKGDWVMKVVSPYQVFVRDAGIGIDSTNVPEWAFVHEETLEWAEARWPDRVRDLSNGELRVHPESAARLIQSDPTLGSPSLLRGIENLGVFGENVVVKEYIKLPWLEWDPQTRRYAKNLGRWIVIISDCVVVDSTLLRESLNQPGEYVPLINLQFIPWEYIDGGRRTTVGQSLWDRIFSAQDAINVRMAQVWAVNQRGAFPWYLQARSLQLETRQADALVPFRRVLCDFEGNTTQLPFQEVNNTTIASGVYEEINFSVSYIGKQVVEVERGQTPPGVSAATAIAYLKTESGEKRRSRIKRLREGLTRAWSHGVRCMAAWYIEDRPYSYTDESGEERYSFIHGNVIAESKPVVDIYPAPDYDAADLRRENIRDMVGTGILDPKASPRLNRKIVAAMDESLDFFMDDDLQEEQASREWSLFKDFSRVPQVDPSLDDHQAHWEEHGRKCFSEWFRQIEDAANWDGALAILGGDWDESLQNIVMMAAMQGNPVPGVPGVPGVPSAPTGAPMMAAPPSPPTSPLALGSPISVPPVQAPGIPAAPMPPPPPISVQPAVLSMWQQKLTLGGFASPSPDSLSAVLNWRSHMEAHRLVGEVRAMREQLKAASMGAPGRGSTPSSPAEEAAGAPPANVPPPQPQ